MLRINLADIDKNLLADIDEITYCELYEFPYEHATVSNQRFQMVWCPEINRAGIVFVGSGSSGATFWTDAVSPDDAMQQYLADELNACWMDGG